VKCFCPGISLTGQDIDWEYPGGNGEDYKQTPNSAKVSEIETYPLFLAEIKKAIGSKELSIAVPGREDDMMAFTAQQVPKINAAVDFVNVRTRIHPLSLLTFLGHDV
jgi:chitinase